MTRKKMFGKEVIWLVGLTAIMSLTTFGAQQSHTAPKIIELNPAECSGSRVGSLDKLKKDKKQRGKKLWFRGILINEHLFIGGGSEHRKILESLRDNGIAVKVLPVGGDSDIKKQMDELGAEYSYNESADFMKRARENHSRRIATIRSPWQPNKTGSKLSMTFEELYHTATALGLTETETVNVSSYANKKWTVSGEDFLPELSPYIFSASIDKGFIKIKTKFDHEKVSVPSVLIAPSAWKDIDGNEIDRRKKVVLMTFDGASKSNNKEYYIEKGYDLIAFNLAADNLNLIAEYLIDNDLIMVVSEGDKEKYYTYNSRVVSSEDYIKAKWGKKGSYEGIIRRDDSVDFPEKKEDIQTHEICGDAEKKTVEMKKSDAENVFSPEEDYKVFTFTDVPKSGTFSFSEFSNIKAIYVIPNEEKFDPSKIVLKEDLRSPSRVSPSRNNIPDNVVCFSRPTDLRYNFHTYKKLTASSERYISEYGQESRKIVRENGMCSSVDIITDITFDLASVSINTHGKTLIFSYDSIRHMLKSESFTLLIVSEE